MSICVKYVAALREHDKWPNNLEMPETRQNKSLKDEIWNVACNDFQDYSMQFNVANNEAIDQVKCFS